MTRNQYRKALKTVGLSILGAARFFGVTERSGIRWAKDGPPEPVAAFLRLMVALDLSAEKAKSLIDGQS